MCRLRDGRHDHWTGGFQLFFSALRQAIGNTVIISNKHNKNNKNNKNKNKNDIDIDIDPTTTSNFKLQTSNPKPQTLNL